MRTYVIAVSLLMLIAATSASASGNLPIIEYDKRQGQDGRMQSFGSDLLGDQIDPHTGAISFEHTDVVLPGNSGLDVSVRRRRSQGYWFDSDVMAEFGDWTLQAPRINVISGTNPWTGARCTASYDTTLPHYVVGSQGTPVFYYNRDYSEGVVLDVPGYGSQQILWNPPTGASTPFPTGTAHVTTENWRFLCNVTANDGGEGFTGIAPNGDTYRFDRLITRAYKPLGSVGGADFLPRTRNYLAATRVTDVNGNTVDYTYDASGRLTQISANDGRTITISYQGASLLVYQVTANGRSWTYSYAASTWEGLPDIGDNPAQAAQLRTVLLPDGTSWTINFDGMEAQPTGGVSCNQLAATLTITHPNGAVGTFVIRNAKHRQSFDLVQAYTQFCPGSPDNHPVPGSPPQMYTAQFFKSQSVESKTITAPAAATATWTYDYENDFCSPLSSTCQIGPECAAGEPCRTNWTKVTEPNGRHLTYYHYWNAEFGVDCTQASCPNTILPPGNPLGGKLARLDLREGGATGTLLERTDYQYYLEGTLPELFGRTFARTGFVAYHMVNPARTDVVTITRNGDTYTTNNDYVSTISSATYSYGFPTKVTETSSTAPSLSRVADTVYAHNKTKWVLGLPSTVTRNGKLFNSYTYDANGRVDQESEFGAVKKTFTYHTAAGQQGAVNTITDSHGHVWTLSNWKRGKPQTITDPIVPPATTATTFTRVVDNNGWVTSETDRRGNLWGFSYNNVGWLTGVDRPSVWNDSALSYTFGAGAVQQVETRGNLEIYTWYDSYLRPYRVRKRSLVGDAATTHEWTSYDALGRVTLKTWPSSLFTPTDGVRTTYDALSRPTRVEENVPPYYGTTTTYQSGGVTVASEDTELGTPAVTTTTARAFGDPSKAEVMSVKDPLNATTRFTRDIYGNMLTLEQTDYNGTASLVTRQFWYNNDLLLCRHRAPEFGDEVFVYDTEGQLTQSGRGETAATTCVTSVPTGISVTRAYDPRHRETSITFPAGTTAITRKYDENSNVTEVARGGAGTWTYLYTALDRISQEKLVIDGRTYQFDYGINLNGDINSRLNNHAGLGLIYDANAFGQARGLRTSATTYVSGAVYHENGLIEAATYANGHALTQSFDGRQKPAVLKTVKAAAPASNAVWLSYGYNARGRVSAVIDYDGAGVQGNSSFYYDKLGRLDSATGPFGASGAAAAADYDYDALSNIRTRNEGTSTASIAYASGNRVTSATVNGATRTFAYDARGNATDNGPIGFVYDFANQPTRTLNSSGGTIADYLYDGNLKRVKEVRAGKTIYTIYSKATGGLIYRDQATDAVKTDYASAGGAALRLKKTGTGAFVPEYTHFDAQGSAVAATDAAGTVTWREVYAPFGEERLNPAANDNNTGYTGHLKDDATGLSYMQARYYDPLIGRFLSTDPIGYQDQLNLYAYVHNDPVNKVDPNGEAAQFVVKFGADVVLEAAIQYATTGTINPASVLKEAAIGTLNPAKTLERAKDLGNILRNVAKGADDAAQAATKAGATAQGVGNAADKGAKAAVEKLGDARVSAQSSRQAGAEVPYGTKGSSRSDVEVNHDGRTIALDNKTGDATMGSRQVGNYQTNYRADAVVEIKITPDEIK